MGHDAIGIGLDARIKAENILIDNGVAPDEAGVVLQAIGYALLNRELYPERWSDNNDPVNHPSHYTDGKIEVIDFIFDKGFGKDFCLGNAIKYISRAGKKDPEKEIEDLRKAVWYLEHYIEWRKTNAG